MATNVLLPDCTATVYSGATGTAVITGTIGNIQKAKVPFSPMPYDYAQIENIPTWRLRIDIYSSIPIGPGDYVTIVTSANASNLVGRSFSIISVEEDTGTFATQILMLKPRNIPGV